MPMTTRWPCLASIAPFLAHSCNPVALTKYANRAMVSAWTFQVEEETMAAGRNETMGQRLQRLRRAASLTQAELAERAGVPLRSLLNWEQDRRQPRLDPVVDLARTLGVTLEDLAANVAPREEREPPQKGRPPALSQTTRSEEQKAKGVSGRTQGKEVGAKQPNARRRKGQGG